MFTINKRRSKL